MPKVLSRIMKPGQTSWKSPTPLSSRIGVTGFNWMQHYYAHFESDAHVDIGSSWRTRLLQPFSMLRHLASDAYVVVFQTARWGTIAANAAVKVDGLFQFTGDVQELYATRLEVV